METGLAWDIDMRSGTEIISKGGAVAGFMTFIGYSPKTRVGVVALANTSAGEGTTDIGLHLLDARYPLWVPDNSPTNESTLQASVLDNYVGHYELTPVVVVSVTREGDQLYARLTSQPQAAIYPKGNNEFFYKIVDAQVTFETPAPGQPASAFVLHQGGRDMRAPRIDADTAKQLEDTVAQRFKDQKPLPGSEAELRREIDELHQGQGGFDRMTPLLAQAARPQFDHTKKLVDSLGALQTVTFKGVGPGGFDIYDVKFENGSLDWRILLDADGKIAGLAIRPQP